jgi:acyl-CoA thioesterase I
LGTLFRAFIIFVLLGMVGAAGAQTPKPRILVMGDSLMASNRIAGAGVSDALARALGVKVKDHSVIGARYFYILPITGSMGLRIEAQLRGGPWDYVVMNGGGNDLLFGCGCGACSKMMDRLVTSDGKSGSIPELVAKVRETGAKVIYTGYMRTPGVTSPVEGCGPLGDEMDRRLAKMSRRQKGVEFVPLADLVAKDGDKSYHGVDLIHPSAKGSKAIASRVLAAMGIKN